MDISFRLGYNDVDIRHMLCALPWRKRFRWRMMEIDVLREEITGLRTGMETDSDEK